MKKERKCNECPVRQKYDRNPKSFVGKLWRWHIGFCPGWKSYMASLGDEERRTLKERYGLE